MISANEAKKLTDAASPAQDLDNEILRIESLIKHSAKQGKSERTIRCELTADKVTDIQRKLSELGYVCSSVAYKDDGVGIFTVNWS